MEAEFKADQERGMVGTEGGSFAIIGFNGYVGREAELASAIAMLINNSGQAEAFPMPRACSKCGGFDLQEIPGFLGGGITCATCEPPEDSEE